MCSPSRGAPGWEEPGGTVEADQTHGGVVGGWEAWERGAATGPARSGVLPQNTCFHAPERFSSSSSVWNLNSCKTIWVTEQPIFKMWTFPGVLRSSSHSYIIEIWLCSQISSSYRLTKAHHHNADRLANKDPSVPGASCPSHSVLPSLSYQKACPLGPWVPPSTFTHAIHSLWRGLTISIWWRPFLCQTPLEPSPPWSSVIWCWIASSGTTWEPVLPVHLLNSPLCNLEVPMTQQPVGLCGHCP